MAPHRPLRFCHITTFFPPENFGGDGIFVHRLARELAARGHVVEVIHDLDAYRSLHHGATPPASAPLPGVKVHRLRSRFGWLSPFITQQLGVPGLKGPRLRSILADGRFDVIHYHNISLVGGPGLLRYGNAIKLYTTHEHWLVCPMHVLWRYDREVCPGKECLRCQIRGGRPPQWWRYSGLLERSLKEVDAFIPASEFTRERHLRELALPMVENPIPYFLPSGIEAAAARTPHERPYFLFVGRLEKIKGLQVLIAAFRGYEGADLLVAGDGEYAATLRSLAADVPQVRFLGALPYERLVPLYRGALAVLVPSICVETFGMVVMEAFAQHTPAIVHRLGALPELVEQSDGGFVYETQDDLRSAMEALRTNRALRDRLGENGYASYRARWTPEQHLRQYFGLIRDVAVRKGDRDAAAAAEAAIEGVRVAGA